VFLVAVAVAVSTHKLLQMSAFITLTLHGWWSRSCYLPQLSRSSFADVCLIEYDINPWQAPSLEYQFTKLRN